MKIVNHHYIFFSSYNVDLMIRYVGYISSWTKDVYVKFLVAVPGTVETAWPPQYYFVWETFEGQYGLDKLALKKYV